MTFTPNLCTVVLPDFSYNEVLTIAVNSGYKGIELRVDDNCHKSLEELSSQGNFIKRQLDQFGIQVPILNSYIPVNDDHRINLLLYCCQKMGIAKARVVLPRSCHGSVSRQAGVKTIIPAYETYQEPSQLIIALKKQLKRLENKARKAGVKLLLEIHWGSVMSSFSSTYLLTHDLDPNCIGVTFDPANMIIEGKEDWEFGIKLIRSHIANVHIKNVVWTSNPWGWFWQWSPAIQGMVNWGEIISLLTQNQFNGDYAIEDFSTPNNSAQSAINYLTWVRAEIEELHECYGDLADKNLLAIAS